MKKFIVEVSEIVFEKDIQEALEKRFSQIVPKTNFSIKEVE